MPTPSRTSIEQIVRAGAEVLDEHGAHALTMQAVASRVGVRAPSLYRHVTGREELVRLVTEDAVRALGAELGRAAPVGSDHGEALRAAARTLRALARRRPAAFRLVFRPGPDASRARPEVAREALVPVLRAAEGLVGAEDSLPAARTFTAWATGFISMELDDAFRMGGDVDLAFEFGLDHVVRSLGSADSGPRPRGT